MQQIYATIKWTKKMKHYSHKDRHQEMLTFQEFTKKKKRRQGKYVSWSHKII